MLLFRSKIFPAQTVTFLSPRIIR